MGSHFDAYPQLLGRQDDPDFTSQMDPARWPMLKEKFIALFRTQTRDEWRAILEGTNACFSPILSMAEAPLHPHNAARSTLIDVGGIIQPAPAPCFSKTPARYSVMPEI